MVTQCGFSDELGMESYGDNQDEVFLGKSMGRQQHISESTAQKIDAEVKRLIEQGYGEAKRIITERNDGFVRIAKGLLEFETLSSDELKALLDGRPVIRIDPDDSKGPTGSAVPSAGTPRSRDEPGAGSLEPQAT